eukprot:scaffold36298_cov122-Isochrysis_galbana.AAC.6
MLQGVRATMAKVATRRAAQEWSCGATLPVPTLAIVALTRHKQVGAGTSARGFNGGISGATGLAGTLGTPGRSRPMPAPLMPPRGPGSAWRHSLGWLVSTPNG